jgi:hypothetical protein
MVAQYNSFAQNEALPPPPPPPPSSPEAAYETEDDDADIEEDFETTDGSEWEETTLQSKRAARPPLARSFSEAQWRREVQDPAFNYTPIGEAPKAEVPEKQEEAPKYEKRDVDIPDISLEPKPRPKPSNFSTIIIIAIAAIMVGLIVYIMFGDYFRSRKNAKPFGLQKEPDWDDVYNYGAYEKDIEDAEKAGNYKLAVRLNFLRLIKTLNQQGFIVFEEGTSNSTYLLQMHKRGMHKAFAQPLRTFNYVWFGNYDITQEQYNQYKAEVQVLIANVS